MTINDYIKEYTTFSAEIIKQQLDRLPLGLTVGESPLKLARWQNHFRILDFSKTTFRVDKSNIIEIDDD